ncbi:MAG: MFS transporter [Chloroflexota bacterium]
MQTNSSRPFGRVRDIYNEYPRQFWILVGASFIDHIGGALLFPFFTLYITQKFGVGMTQVGILFTMFSISGVMGSMIGGALTDRLGRKGMVLFGLVMSAMSSLLLGFVNRIELFFIVSILVGMLANAGGPAQQAMVADLLPEKKRAQGFGILRISFNLAVTIGPMIGGFLASQSFLLLFICDAVASSITAIVFYLSLAETRPAPVEGEPQPSMAQTFSGYLKVMRDTVFVWFLGASALMVLVYIQMNTTLAVYLRDTHGISTQMFGYILSLNAGMVVLFQFPITRWISKYRPLVVMAAGTLLYALGFGMYGLVSSYIFFLVAMVIITIGEMLISPVGQAIVSQLAPEDMRGRYMAVFGFSWVIPSAIGPLLAGIIMDNADPHWVWYATGVVGLVAAAAYYLLEWRSTRSRWSAIDRRLAIIEQLEERKITAVEAASQLESVQEGPWSKLEQPVQSTGRRHLRIRVSDMATGMMKTDMRLPVGLVNTVLYVGGRLTTDFDSLLDRDLQALAARSASDGASQTMQAGRSQRVEISLESDQEPEE